KNQTFFKKDLNCWADYAKIQKSVQLRTRQPGDYYRPAGRHVRKTLKKYYNEQGIPETERPLLPLLADGSEVLWLWGSGFAEGLAPDVYSRNVLIVRTEKQGEAP
ncbi:MAG: tRNA lysidine(34) synthetase TilS, partial [Gemmiger sp.]